MFFSAEQRHMCDIHIHIIPGVDDGSWSLDMSCAMMDMAYRQGVRKMIAASHSSAFDEQSNSVKAAFQELKKRIQEITPHAELYLGCEVYCSKGNLEDVLDKLSAGIYPSLNGTRYVLTEFSTWIEQEEALYCLDVLMKAGWIPVIAHVERYKNLFGEKDCLEQLKKKGILLQINVYSVFEENDDMIKRNAIGLIERRFADFLGSDGHRTNHRPPSVEEGLKYLYDNFDSDYIDKIAFRNAEHFLLT